MDDLLSKIVSLSKRRGFIFPSSEIYGGFASCYDYGPLGVEVKRNIKQAWWDEMIKKEDNIVGLDSSILTPSKIWEASGHLTAGFADELVECKSCHKRFKLDEIKDKCPGCKGELTKPRQFNLMMKTFVGPIEDENSVSYLRAETCQGIYVNFENVMNSMRLKIPFGICQIGKSFRNEITPKDFIFRTREFEQMEMQWFCDSKEADKRFDYWQKKRLQWYLDLGIKKENLRIVKHKDLPHYAKAGVDIEYRFPFGWKEIEGIHNRGDWDLSSHAKASGKNLYIPNVIETSAGVERSFLVFLLDAFQEVKGGRTKTTESAKETESLLKFHKRIAPIKAAVLPLVKNKPELIKKAKKVYSLLKPYFLVQYDETGSIGRRYRRQDEIGTLFSITIDFEEDVTVRDRDTMKQERVSIKDIAEFLKDKLDV